MPNFSYLHTSSSALHHVHSNHYRHYPTTPTSAARVAAIEASENFNKKGLVAAHWDALHDAHVLEKGLRPVDGPLPELPNPTIPLQSLKPILIKDLKLGKVHRSRALNGTLCTKSLKMQSIVNVLEDETGLATKLVICNALPMKSSVMQAQRLYPEGSKVAVLEPYLAEFDDGTIGLLVEKPSDVVFLWVPEYIVSDEESNDTATQASSEKIVEREKGKLICAKQMVFPPNGRDHEQASDLGHGEHGDYPIKKSENGIKSPRYDAKLIVNELANGDGLNGESLERNSLKPIIEPGIQQTRETLLECQTHIANNFVKKNAFQNGDRVMFEKARSNKLADDFTSKITKSAAVQSMANGRGASLKSDYEPKNMHERCAMNASTTCEPCISERKLKKASCIDVNGLKQEHEAPNSESEVKQKSCFMKCSIVVAAPGVELPNLEPKMKKACAIDGSKASMATTSEHKVEQESSIMNGSKGREDRISEVQMKSKACINIDGAKLYQASSSELEAKRDRSCIENDRSEGGEVASICKPESKEETCITNELENSVFKPEMEQENGLKVAQDSKLEMKQETSTVSGSKGSKAATRSEPEVKQETCIVDELQAGEAFFSQPETHQEACIINGLQADEVSTSKSEIKQEACIITKSEVGEAELSRPGIKQEACIISTLKGDVEAPTSELEEQEACIIKTSKGNETPASELEVKQGACVIYGSQAGEALIFKTDMKKEACIGNGSKGGEAPTSELKMKVETCTMNGSKDGQYAAPEPFEVNLDECILNESKVYQAPACEQEIVKREKSTAKVGEVPSSKLEGYVTMHNLQNAVGVEDGETSNKLAYLSRGAQAIIKDEDNRLTQEGEDNKLTQEGEDNKSMQKETSVRVIDSSFEPFGCLSLIPAEQKTQKSRESNEIDRLTDLVVSDMPVPDIKPMRREHLDCGETYSGKAKTFVDANNPALALLGYGSECGLLRHDKLGGNSYYNRSKATLLKPADQNKAQHGMDNSVEADKAPRLEASIKSITNDNVVNGGGVGDRNKMNTLPSKESAQALLETGLLQHFGNESTSISGSACSESVLLDSGEWKVPQKKVGINGLEFHEALENGSKSQKLVKECSLQNGNGVHGERTGEDVINTIEETQDLLEREVEKGPFLEVTKNSGLSKQESSHLLSQVYDGPEIERKDAVMEQMFHLPMLVGNAVNSESSLIVEQSKFQAASHCQQLVNNVSYRVFRDESLGQFVEEEALLPKKDQGQAKEIAQGAGTADQANLTENQRAILSIETSPATDEVAEDREKDPSRPSTIEIASEQNHCKNLEHDTKQHIGPREEDSFQHSQTKLEDGDEEQSQSGTKCKKPASELSSTNEEPPPRIDRRNQPNAAGLRIQGNIRFAEADWYGATELYTQAIRIAATSKHQTGWIATGNDELLLGYSNRSEAWLRLYQHEKARADAEQALARDSDHLKSLFRMGRALLGLGRHSEALPYLQDARKQAPSDRELQQTLKLCRTIIKRINSKLKHKRRL